MRTRERWFAPLLQRSLGATSFIRGVFPHSSFRLVKRIVRKGKMIRHIRFENEGKRLVVARSEVDLDHSSPRLVNLLMNTDSSIGDIIKPFNVRRTRLRSTTRTREFHFTGDIKARVWERFYIPSASKKKKSVIN